MQDKNSPCALLRIMAQNCGAGLGADRCCFCFGSASLFFVLSLQICLLFCISVLFGRFCVSFIAFSSDTGIFKVRGFLVNLCHFCFGFFHHSGRGAAVDLFPCCSFSFVL